MTEKKAVILDSPRGPVEIVSASAFFFPNFGGGMQIDWGAKNCGFGQAVFSYDQESGRVKVDSELMSREFITKVMEKMIQDAIFTDFQELIKEVKSISLEETNTIFNFRPHVLQTPFFSEKSEDGTTVVMRWNLSEERVLNVVFDATKVEEIEAEDPYFGMAMHITKNKSFATGFISAEIWSWTIKEKKC